MSSDGRSDQVDDLRRTIARIEGDGSVQTGFGPGAARSMGDGKVALGGPGARGVALDGVLSGGLGRGALHEVVAARPADAATASGFALALAARFAARAGKAGKTVVWILEDGARAETGAPYAPGLLAHGIDPARLVVVGTRTGADTLWAAEEALKCSALAAVVLDLWRTKTYDLVASRRLVLAAGRSGTPGILVPAGAAGAAGALCSAAQSRFEVKSAAGPHRPSAAPPASARIPLPGRAAWAVRLARIRAGPAGIAAGFDWEKFWPLVWEHGERCFCDALPVPPPSHAFDRPHPATGRDRSRAA